MARIRETDRHEGKKFLVWSPRSDLLATEVDPATGEKVMRKELRDVKDGMYLVDPDTGKLAYLKDPTIMGRLTERDDGTRVSREFDAPKTQVMGIIINGVMGRKLNWAMVAIGAMIAIMLELCGVSALAFAVGLYVPIQFSTPIFFGGICRWAIDKYLARQAAAEAGDVANDPEARARAEVEAIRKSETSPGVLLASGYIAGGSLAGVVIAFIAFSDTLTKDLGSYEHRHVAVGKVATVEQASQAVAREELGVGEGELSEKDAARVKELATQIAKLNAGEGILHQWVEVPAGTKLINPDTDKEIEVSEKSYLGDVAKSEMGRRYKAQALFEKNKEKLAEPKQLPAEAELIVPQRKWPAMLAFLALIAVLLAVGGGLLFKQREPAV
jgi:hypothetical protein